MADNEQRGLDEVLNKLPPEDADAIVKEVVAIMKDAADTTRSRVIEAVPDILRSMREKLGYSDAVMDEIEDISSKTGDTREDTLLKALVLYEAALEANQKGQRLVLVGPDYRFIREIVGFDRVDREPVQAGNSAR